MKELHPIQLREILIRKASVVINDHLVALADKCDVHVSMQQGSSTFNRGSSSFQVGLKAEAIPADTKKGDVPAFFIEIEFAGAFEVDYSGFLFEDLERWCQVNAPIILMPFMREHLYGVAIRAGIRGVFLPLVVAKKPGEKL